jgi:lipopolysaccharide/colanic/teichoic acid biosynthesis glycosyltransferase
MCQCNVSRAAKRSFDILVAVIGGLCVLPLLILATVAIRLDSRGSPVFAQQRVGRGRSSFTCFKLRTMKEYTGDVPTHLVSAQAMTRLGPTLRRTKIDELPQLWNVLRGEMSLVGPRPCLPSQEELISERSKNGVFKVRPGITGLAQIHGIDMSNPQMLARVDAEYISNWSFLSDLQILIRTVVGAGRGDSVSGLHRERKT